MKLPKLHLRDLFWLVLVCALGCTWWVEHRHADAQHNAELEEQKNWARFLVETLDGNGVGVKRMPTGFVAYPKPKERIPTGPTVTSAAGS